MKYYITSYILLTAFNPGFTQAGQLDLTFNAIGKVITPFENLSVEANSVLVQPDGNILVSGTVTESGTTKDYAIVRYKANGELDENFNNSGKLTIDFIGNNNFCNSIALQSDDKILVTGTVTTANGRKVCLLRLNNDSSFDTSFGNNGITISDLVNRSEEARAILIQNDGSVIVTGSVDTESFVRLCALYKFDKNGKPDLNFGTLGIATESVPDGYNPRFGIQQPDGKIITGGFILDSNTDIFMMRFHVDGTLDKSFGTNGRVQTDFNKAEEFAYRIALQTDGKILLVVGLRNQGASDFGLVRYHENGSLDSTFGINGKVVTDFSLLSNTAHAITIQEDHKILLAGFLGTTPNHDFALTRYHTNGLLDMDFGLNGKVVTDFGNDDLAFAMTLQSDKKIVVAGHSINSSKIGSFAISRYLSGLERVATKENSIQFDHLRTYPNPTHHETILEYTLNKSQTISIRLFDLSGKLVKNFGEMIEKTVGKNQESLIFSPDIKPGNYRLVISGKESQIDINLIVGY